MNALRWGFLIGTWIAAGLSWWLALKTRRLYVRPARALQFAPKLHKVYDLVAVNDSTVTVLCADCWQPLGTATITGWGDLAETHWREANRGPRPTS